ncbi:MAG: penicillin-binding protein 2 [Firmicutes bacterium]|nr:penicillin-binding protein 2 [Bacillota bacterium]
MAHSSPPRRRRFQLRAAAALLLAALWAVWLLWRVTAIQVLHSGTYAAMAQAEDVHTFTIPATRGSILDAHGHVLALDLPAYTVTAAPRVIEQTAKATNDPGLRNQEARLLARVLPYSVGQLRSALAGNSWYRLIDPFVASARGQVLLNEANALPGITVVPTEERAYPSGPLAAQVVGFVNGSGVGVAGIEEEDNALLAGKAGHETVAFAGNGELLPAWTHKYTAPVAGDSVQLTIDGSIQREAEKLLAADVKRWKAKNGTIIIMDPKTGAVLALANYPTFNPNTYYTFSPVDFTNWAVQDPIPPGSIFKPVTASAGLQDGVVQPTTVFDTVGYKIVDGLRINDWMPNGWGPISFTRGLELSSDQVFMTVGLKLGVQRLYAMARAYGFFHPSNVGLPGDSSGIFIPPNQVNAVDLATIAFGQGIAVTPMQEVTMISAIANDGVVMQPQIRKAVLSPSGQVLQRMKPIREDRAITPFVAHELHVMMEREVGYGTGIPAQVKGYTWAGKTGTAQQVVNGRTSSSVYVSSYAGYGPMPHPRFAMVVMLNDPKGAIYGAQVSAPTWAKMAAWLMKYWRIPPNLNNNLPNGVAQGNSIPPG